MLLAPFFLLSFWTNRSTCCKTFNQTILVGFHCLSDTEHPLWGDTDVVAFLLVLQFLLSPKGVQGTDKLEALYKTETQKIATVNFSIPECIRR